MLLLLKICFITHSKTIKVQKKWCSHVFLFLLHLEQTDGLHTYPTE